MSESEQREEEKSRRKGETTSADTRATGAVSCGRGTSFNRILRLPAAVSGLAQPSGGTSQAGLEQARLTSSTSRCFSSSSTLGRLEGSLAKQASRKSEQSLDTQAYAQSSSPLHLQTLVDPVHYNSCLYPPLSSPIPIRSSLLSSPLFESHASLLLPEFEDELSRASRHGT